MADSGCGLPVGGPSLEGVDIARATIIEGVVSRDEGPVDRAYVQLLDADGEFVAEVITDTAGHYRFFAAPGAWTLSVLHRHGRVRESVALDGAGVTDVALVLA